MCVAGLVISSCYSRSSIPTQEKPSKKEQSKTQHSEEEFLPDMAISATSACWGLSHPFDSPSPSSSPPSSIATSPPSISSSSSSSSSSSASFCTYDLFSNARGPITCAARFGNGDNSNRNNQQQHILFSSSSSSWIVSRRRRRFCIPRGSVTVVVENPTAASG